VLVDSTGVVLNQDRSGLQTTKGGHNNHGSIELISGQWYVFYHRPPHNFGYARQLMVAPITIIWDEKPVAEGGSARIRAYDPYAEDQIWTAKDNQGNEYTGAEVTSEGFFIYGLPVGTNSTEPFIRITIQPGIGETWGRYGFQKKEQPSNSTQLLI
jgi:arabinoxylan arabinofuranohydrolase